jgi:hypothetical protein
MGRQPYHHTGVAHRFEKVLDLVLFAIAKSFVRAAAVVPDRQRPEFGHFRQELGILHQGESASSTSCILPPSAR